MDVKTIRNYANKAASIGTSLMDGVNFYIVSPRINIGKFPINIPFCLPYNPEKVTISEGGRHRTVDIIGLGEILLTESPHLAEISFESFFPEKDYMLHLNKLGSWLKPQLWIEAFEAAMEMKEPLRLVITGVGYNSLVVIKDFKYDHHGGTYEDKYYSIVFQQYKEYTAKILNDKNKKSTPEELKPSEESQTIQNKAGTALGEPAQGIKMETIFSDKPMIQSPVTITGDAEIIDDLSDPWSKFDAATSKSFYSPQGKLLQGQVSLNGYDGYIVARELDMNTVIVENAQTGDLFETTLGEVGIVDA